MQRANKAECRIPNEDDIDVVKRWLDVRAKKGEIPVEAANWGSLWDELVWGSLWDEQRRARRCGW